MYKAVNIQVFRLFPFIGPARCYTTEKLTHRGLICIRGSDSSTFLQGLITNDMRHLEEGSKSMYTLLLNTKGRVLFDAIIYKDNDNFLVESEKTTLPDLQKHLKMFKVRRKIDIDIVDDAYNVWVLYNRLQENTIGRINANDHSKDGVNHPEDNASMLEHVHSSSKIVCRDPRLAVLGYRIIAPVEKDFEVRELHREEPDDYSYKTLRYQLGIAEGLGELPPEKCFPLEVNCDYLHGVSFHKGCYIGQELTARVYHTGMVRKRLMPIKLEEQPTEPFALDSPVCNAMTNKSVGKLRGLVKTYGLGLLRIDEALKSPALEVLQVTGYTIKPDWWPQESPKERSAAVGKDP